MLDRFIDWMTIQPTIGLLMTITAVILFGASFAKSKETVPTFWGWLKRVIEASGRNKTRRKTL